MSTAPFDGLILVRHCITGGVTTAAAMEALPETWRSLVRGDLELAIDNWPQDSAGVDWLAARAAQERWYQSQLGPLLRRSPSYAVAYFGLAPIPLALHLGYLVPSATRVTVFQHNHVTHAWAWEEHGEATVRLVEPDLPREPIDVRGDARLLLAVSYPVDVVDTSAVVPDPIASVEYRLDRPALDGLRSPADLERVARAVVGGMEAIAAARRNVEAIHLFVAGPVGLMFRIGTLVNQTIVPQVITYQYHRSRAERYERAVDLSRRSAVTPVTADQAATAAILRALWSEELNDLSREARRSARDLAGRPWYHGLPVPGWVAESPWARLAAVHESPLDGSSISVRTEERDSFRYDPIRREWIFDDRLLVAIAARLEDAGARRRAGRLFLLHEALHHHCQDLDASTGRRVGVDHPALIEEIDYRADVWGILTDLRTRMLDGADATRWLIESIDVHLDVSWAFVSSDEAARRIEVRRARRFLIWHWQRELLVRLQERPSADVLARSVSLLLTKPEVSLSGAPIHAEDRRVYFRLDRPFATPPELACLDGQQRLRRAGASAGLPVQEIFEGFQEGDRVKVENAVRAFQRFAAVSG